MLGGGSNVVVADEGFPGTVVEVATRGIEPDLDDDVEASCSGATVKVAAGEPWDPFVALAVEKRWAGIEALAGIPGHVGATPIQNVGAYGQEVSQTIASASASGTASCAAYARSPPPTAASATAPAASSRTPAATSSST